MQLKDNTQTLFFTALCKKINQVKVAEHKRQLHNNKIYITLSIIRMFHTHFCNLHVYSA